MTEQTSPKAPNLDDLRTMAEIGYPAKLSPAWLRWIVEQLDAAGAVPDTGHPRLAEFRSLVEYAEQRDGVSVILPAAAARSLLDELAASAPPSGDTGQDRATEIDWPRQSTCRHCGEEIDFNEEEGEWWSDSDDVCGTDLDRDHEPPASASPSGDTRHPEETPMPEQTPAPATPGLDAMHVVSQHRGQEWRDVTPIRAWAEELVSHGGMNAAVGRGVLAKLDEGQAQPSGDTGQGWESGDVVRDIADAYERAMQDTGQEARDA